MNVADFDYNLPQELIAQVPMTPRDASRLMTLNRQSGNVTHRQFTDISDLLLPGDVLVMNNTRVIPARLTGQKRNSGGHVEILLLKQLDTHSWRALIGGKRVRLGTEIEITGSSVTAVVEALYEGSERLVRFSESIEHLLPDLGEMPLPPYIHERLTDQERYQTVYSQQEGSAAAPTAGLHFTPELLMALRDKGVQLAYCTLHIGLDTFQPVKVDRVENHQIHSEYAMLDADNAKMINDAKLRGSRIIAVGTTSARTLETSAILSAGGNPADPHATLDICAWRPAMAFSQDTNLFIYPGYEWRLIDAMITNFHLPRSSLLMMISAFAGREAVLNAYAEAVRESYRFFSFGDAMFIH